MATFISKEELLGSASGGEVVKEVGALPAQPTTGGISDMFGQGGGDFLDKLDRVLTRVDSSLQTIERIRGNPLIKAATAPQKTIQAQFTAVPQTAAPAQSTAPQPASATAQAQTTAAQPAPRELEFNVEGAKEILAELMQQLEGTGEDTKKITLGQLLNDYKSPLKRGFIEAVVLGRLQENFRRLIK